MTGLQLPGEDLFAFDHLVGYGAAAILAAAGSRDVRIGWTNSETPRLTLTGTDWDTLGATVHQHALDHTLPTSWVQADGTIQGAGTGLFSPRVKAMSATEIRAWYGVRHRVIDTVSGRWAALDLDLIGALGEPSYWSFDRDEARPDHGASRWEMKTRNRGEEFVKHRLRLLANSVAARSPEEVTAGLRGDTMIDEVGKNSSTSRTPTGLMPPRATDNARAWCALWGLSLLSVTSRPTGASRSAGHIGHHSRGHLALPVVTRQVPVERLRSLVRSRAMLTIATTGLAGRESEPATATDADRLAAWAWLEDRGIPAIVRFTVHRSANASAPEKWAEHGRRLFRGVDS